MSAEVEFIAPEATAQEAAELMGELDVGALPVGSAEDLRGVVTGRDLLYRVVAAGRDPASVRVREVMSSPAIACRPNDGLRQAMDLMTAQNLRRLAVQDAQGKVVGWVTLADIARRLLVEDARLQQALRGLTESAA
ncbi:CBS domain-containing protein [Pseudoroseomonas rhizosphaerae]|uniref:CBS domain-containing protein n=2 Tax=Teichococcus rhizosphaerae TaxID=1335062 RepID=A0A2C7A8K8_9PROT|nr:CBS domain-containing protein [Pseudoroseomonas rhizosphaerae]